MSKAIAVNELYRTHPAPGLRVEYYRPEELQRQPAEWWREVLAVVRFDAGADRASLDGVPVVDVSAPVLRIAGGNVGGDAAAGPAESSPSAASTTDAARGGAEVWRLSGPMSCGEFGRLRYRRNGELLFATIAVSESDFTCADPAEALRAATQSVYSELFAGLERLGFAHPVRIWHFLPSINASLGEAERYWHFNSARQTAFLHARRSVRGEVPAASTVGTTAGTELMIYCIAARDAPIALENPRQCSAWAYPPQYGPSSPTFARACIEARRDANTLFISGTASIVGHQSTHVGDAVEQTREVMRNLGALLQAANARMSREQPHRAPFRLECLRYKAYLRRPQDQPRVEQVMRDEAGIRTPVLYLQADLCRRELLVEIEASGTCADG